MRWAIGGWSFFILENLVLSENRSYIIERVGDERYHMIYGTISTCAMASVGYGYFKVRRTAPFRITPLPVSMRVVSFLSYAVGLGLLSQTAPKLQVPVTSNDEEEVGKVLQGPVPLQKKTSKAWKVRCPFDFTDNSLDSGPRGVERISRHPGLWAFGLTCLGTAAITPSIAQASWLSMPVFVALIGGAHTDARYRRGMGGTLRAEDDENTSNIPFLGLVKIGRVDPIIDLWHEIKGINASFAIAVATAIAFRKPRTI